LKKKILFITDNFPPEVNAPATRTYEHCLTWTIKGYDITVITCVPNFPKGEIFNGYKNKFLQIENYNGIKVVRVWSFISSNEGFFKRTLDYISFGIMSFLVGLFFKTDLIVATSPQFFSAISGSMLAFFKRKKWIMEVRDLWPNSISAVGAINENSILFSFLKSIENILYYSASKIVVVTDSFNEYLIKFHKVEKNKIGIFKNGYLNHSLKPNENTISVIKENLNCKNKIIISYIGTLGLAHGLRFILETINDLKINSNYHFLFIGEGAQKKELIEYTIKHSLKNVSFINSMSKNEIINYIHLSDISLVNLIKSDEFKNVIPSKIFENIAAYKPILLGVEGEAKILIEKYKVGVPFEPENKNSFFNAIEKAYQLSKKDSNFRINCDKLIYDFNRKVIAEKMLNFITN
jgi:glycosyltransferase involved in cell wall biosynthesis